MPVKELITALDVAVPANVREVSDGLVYRDFITVGLLVKRLKVTEHKGQPIKDNWIYIQEPDVLLGRLQVFNNWSPYMVADPNTIWLGLEYFCYETDELWKLSPEEMIRLAGEELERIGIIDAKDILDGTVVHVPKTYPAYFGTYDRFDEVRDIHRSIRQSVSGRPQRNAQIQQSRPLHAHGDAGRRQHHRWKNRQGRHLEREHRNGVP